MAETNRTGAQQAAIPGSVTTKRWLVAFIGSCIGLLAFVYLALWVFNGFRGVGLDWTGTIALTLGTIVAAGLGVALMGLIFYSDRSERDHRVGGFDPRD
jgi:hypothetical protein